MSSDESDDKKLTPEELEAEIDNLSPEQRDQFMRALEMIHKRHRIMFWGYMAALLAATLSTFVSIYLYIHRDEGEFIQWVILLPFAAVGLTVFLFGRWAKKVAMPHSSSPSPDS